MNELIMQLIEEETLPEEMFLENIVEEAVDAEQSAISQEDDFEDELIERINAGMRMGYRDAVDFTDAEVNSAVFDDLTDDNDK